MGTSDYNHCGMAELPDCGMESVAAAKLGSSEARQFRRLPTPALLLPSNTF
jgi:hypothetical protein